MSSDKTLTQLRQRAKRLTAAKELAKLGFPLPVCIDALARYGGDKERTANWLVENERKIHWEDNLQQLMKMGFSREICQKSLKHASGDVEVAARWILEQMNHAGSSEKGIPSTTPDNVRNITLDLDRDGRMGLVMDPQLRIIGANAWAKKFGAKVGQQIIGCDGVRVSSIREMRRAHASSGAIQNRYVLTVKEHNENSGARPVTMTKSERALFSMGFPLPDCREALRRAHNEKHPYNAAQQLRVAMELLLSGKIDSTKTTQQQKQQQEIVHVASKSSERVGPSSNVSPEAVKLLEDMGFEAEACYEALRRSRNDVSSAVDLLASMNDEDASSSNTATTTLPPPPPYRDSDATETRAKMPPPPSYDVAASSGVSNTVAVPMKPPKTKRARAFSDFRSKHSAEVAEMPPHKVQRMLKMKPERWSHYLQVARAHDGDANAELSTDELQQQITDVVRPITGDGWNAKRRRGRNSIAFDGDASSPRRDSGEDLEEPPPSALSAARKSKWNLLSSIFRPTGERNVLLGHLNDYDNELREELRRRQGLFRQLRITIEKAESGYACQVATLRSWGWHELLPLFERRQLLQKQRHNHLKQLHRSAGQILSDRIREVSTFQQTFMAISKTTKKSELPKLPQIDESFFVEPHDLVSRDPATRALKEFMAQLTKRLRAADREIAKLSDRLQPKSNEERTQVMRRLVKGLCTRAENQASSILLVATPEEHSDFLRIMLDQRTKQGRLWKRWRQKIEESTKSKGGSTVTVFVKYLADVLGYDFDLEEPNELASLRLLVEVLVYTELFDLCTSSFRLETEPKDAAWRDRFAAMRGMSAAAVGVERRFCKSRELWERPVVEGGALPFKEAATALRRFTKKGRMVPHEMLAAMMTAVRAMNREANESAIASTTTKVAESSKEDNSDNESAPSPTGSLLTAEDVLPIMVFVVIQAGLTCPYLALRFADEFGTRAQSGGGGEAAYYLCMLESAVVFICSMDDSEIENSRTDVDDDASVVLNSKTKAIPDRQDENRKAVGVPDPSEESQSKKNSSDSSASLESSIARENFGEKKEVSSSERLPSSREIPSETGEESTGVV